MQEITAVSYPRFVYSDSRRRFFHWLNQRWDCYCNDCLCIQDVIRHGTNLCLQQLYIGYHRLTEGSNVVSINMGRMTGQDARNILKKYPYGDNSARSIATDFPGLEVEDPQMCVYTPLMDGNALYQKLSEIYLAAMGYGETTLSEMAVIDFVVLCFHLSGELHFTPDATSVLWSETLKGNTILLLNAGTDPLEDTFEEMKSILFPCDFPSSQE